MKIKRQRCGAHFKGKDGLGTCDTECQWYRPKRKCPCSEEMVLKFSKSREAIDAQGG